ncbi:hypothetical protein PGB90_010305 [Kerria lacca]
MSDSTSKSIKYTNVENEKIKVPPPLCPHTLENVLNCIKSKGAQVHCIDLIRKHNDCMIRMTYQNC